MAMKQPALFDDTAPARYPVLAGWKDPTTSRAAAETVDASRLRGLVRECLRTAQALTADECADRLGLSPLAIRPRFSELKAAGALVDTGERHRNRSGKLAKVWRLT